MEEKTRAELAAKRDYSDQQLWEEHEAALAAASASGAAAAAAAADDQAARRKVRAEVRALQFETLRRY